MNFKKQILFWLAALALLVFLLWLLQGILTPFLGGLALAYFLDPVAVRLERLGLSRLAAVAVILLVFIVCLVLALFLLVPFLGGQLIGLRDDLPVYIDSLIKLLGRLNQEWFGDLAGDRVADIQNSLRSYMGQGFALISGLAAQLWSGSQAVFGVISLLIVMPVIAFYILLDWQTMLAKVDSWLPRDHAETIRNIVRDIDRAIAGFVRGQATVCLLLGVFYGIGLSLAGVRFGFLIGLCTGLISFIPYVGSILGFVAAVSVALVQGWPELHLPLIVVAVFVVGQLIEGNYLSPRLVGGSVGLHPVWLMFSIFAAGYLFGFAGMLVAVPMAAVIGVLIRFALAQYLASPLYKGHCGPVVQDQAE